METLTIYREFQNIINRSSQILRNGGILDGRKSEFFSFSRESLHRNLRKSVFQDPKSDLRNDVGF